MAGRIAYYGGIVKNGLILDLDAAKKDSYPGTGTIWRDISGNRNNATMFGAVPFVNDVTSCFDFASATGINAANSSLGFTFGSNMIPRTGNFTLSCWIKNPNLSNQTGLFSNGGPDGYRFGINRTGAYYLIGPTYIEGQINFSSSLLTTLWYNVVAVFSRTTAQVLVYLNGVIQGVVNIPASQTIFQATAPGIVRSACCSIYTGTEVLQNYNATKGRFGL